MIILGTGTAIPEQTMVNPPDTDTWIRANLGVEERRVGGTTSALAIEAAQDALWTAGIDPSQVDVIVVATASPDRLAPATATRVQERIGADRAWAFDINAVCTGFLYAMTLIEGLFESGQARTALIIGADTYSNFTDYAHRDWVFFGDAAGAVVARRGGEPFRSIMRSNGDGWGSWTIPGGASEQPQLKPRWEMVGRDVYATALQVVPDTVNQLLRDTRLAISDVDWFVPHQASRRVLEALTLRLGIPWRRTAYTLPKLGNTAAASIPVSLHAIRDDIDSGDTVLFAAVGAGWTWGAGVLEWI